MWRPERCFSISDLASTYFQTANKNSWFYGVRRNQRRKRRKVESHNLHGYSVSKIPNRCLRFNTRPLEGDSFAVGCRIVPFFLYKTPKGIKKNRLSVLLKQKIKNTVHSITKQEGLLFSLGRHFPFMYHKCSIN